MFKSKNIFISCLALVIMITSIKTEDNKCSPDKLKAFGVSGNLMEDQRPPTPMEKAYCRRNRMTCCSDANIESINKDFVKGLQSFQKKFEIVEEVLSLFKGSKFPELVETIKEKDECSKIVENMNVEISGTKYDFFSTIYQNIKLDEIANILLDVETYIKKVVWFHGDLICSVCNPGQQQFYNFSDGGSSMTVHLSTCFEIMEERDFEVTLIDLYQNFLVPVINLVKCGLHEEDGAPVNAGESLEGDATDPFKLLPVDVNQVETLQNDFKKCIADKQLELPECQKMCSKNLLVYSFPIPNFFRNLQVSLNVLFGALVESSIEDYYTEIKEQEWSLGAYDEPVTFFKSELASSYKIENIQWIYSSNEGLNMYREIMSKKFTNAHFEFDSVSAFAMSIVSAIAMFLYM